MADRLPVAVPPFPLNDSNFPFLPSHVPQVTSSNLKNTSNPTSHEAQDALVLKLSNTNPVQNQPSTYLLPKTNYANVLKNCHFGPPLKDFEFISRTLSKVNGMPSFILAQHEWRAAEKPFNLSLIMKFSGGRPKMEEVKKHVLGWNLSKNPIVGHIDARHVLVFIDNQSDLNNAMARSVRQVSNSLYRLFRWSSEFNPKKESSTTAVWVRFPSLPLPCLHDSIIKGIVNTFGKHIRTDPRSLNLENPSMVRVCVELDLRLELPETLWIGSSKEDGVVQRIIYEGNIHFCKFCELHGHLVEECRKKQRIGNKMSTDKTNQPTMHEEPSQDRLNVVEDGEEDEVRSIHGVRENQNVLSKKAHGSHVAGLPKSTEGVPTRPSQPTQPLVAAQKLAKNSAQIQKSAAVPEDPSCQVIAQMASTCVADGPPVPTACMPPTADLPLPIICRPVPTQIKYKNQPPNKIQKESLKASLAHPTTSSPNNNQSPKSNAFPSDFQIGTSISSKFFYQGKADPHLITPSTNPSIGAKDSATSTFAANLAPPTFNTPSSEPNSPSLTQSKTTTKKVINTRQRTLLGLSKEADDAPKEQDDPFIRSNSVGDRLDQLNGPSDFLITQKVYKKRSKNSKDLS